MSVSDAEGGRVVCSRCGVVLSAAEILAERVLVRAGCCPRCDGSLVTTRDQRSGLALAGAPASGTPGQVATS